MMMPTPARRLGWAGVLILAGIATAAADQVCTLSEATVCGKFVPALQYECTKNVQLAAGFCRKAARQVRFGSHEMHCRAACRAGAQAFELDRVLRNLATTTAEKSSAGDATWLAEARTFWQAQGDEAFMCTAAQFTQARADCDAYCDTKARRRDLEELQALAAGKEFLELQLPVFACPPGPATRLLSQSGGTVLEKLYPQGHPRRSGSAAE
mgnify:CR=1 FL=1